MANILSNVRHPGGDLVTEAFRPQTNFQISVHGTITKDYNVMTLPDEIADTETWISAAVGGTMTDLTDSNRLVSVNYAKGYKYRIEAATGDIEVGATFYWGNSTSVNYSVG